MNKKWLIAVVCICMVIIIGLQFGKNGDATVFEPHREDFSTDIESTIMQQFNGNIEVKKAYLLRTNDWFLAEDLTDFSQVVTTDIMYVVPGGETGTDLDTAYSFYDINEEGVIEWKGSAYPPANALVPFGFSGLTYEMIDRALVGIEYEDYIITYSQRSSTVFVWVRCAAEDVLLTYPTRPDLLGIENGGIYTLEEVKDALANAYGH